jgi:hypothetical protein
VGVCSSLGRMMMKLLVLYLTSFPVHDSFREFLYLGQYISVCMFYILLKGSLWWQAKSKNNTNQ